ncbi:hypothetical protein CK934_25995 [Chitinophaga sp. MD30]|nr:hypothetical protein CK934_25995 [Chitinophaga sp. MD30]
MQSYLTYILYPFLFGFILAKKRFIKKMNSMFSKPGFYPALLSEANIALIYNPGYATIDTI